MTGPTCSFFVLTIRLTAGLACYFITAVRRQLSPLADDARQLFYDPVNLGFARITAERETDGAMDGGEGDSHGPEHMARLQRARGTGGARRGTDVGLIKPKDLVSFVVIAQKIHDLPVLIRHPNCFGLRKILSNIDVPLVHIGSETPVYRRQ